MPNDWFQFKQFRILQGRCAMKVSTDACIQGAWAAARLRDGSKKTETGDNQQPFRLLDIGTGTGLLSLMLAQSWPSGTIEAIEQNEDAFIQAGENFACTDWKENLNVLHITLADFIKNEKIAQARQKYDFIICNPPFFHNHLPAQQVARNEARHSISLSKTELARSVSELLNQRGEFCIMYPQTEWDEWMDTAGKHGLYPAMILEVKPKSKKTVNRIIGLFVREKVQESKKETLVIYQEDMHYTRYFKQLLQPYYPAL